MSGTTVAAAKAFLFAQIPTSVNDPAVHVAYDKPTSDADDIIVVGGTTEDGADQQTNQVSWATLGSGNRNPTLEELYSIVVTIDVFRGSDDHKTTFERATALVDAVVATVRADLSLGGAVMLAHPDGVVYAPSRDEKGTRCLATLSIACQARI